MSRISRASTRAVTVCILVLALTDVAAAQRSRSRGKFVPPDGKVLVFVGAAWGDQVESYTKATGHVPAGVNIFGLFSEDTTFFRHCEQNAPAGAAMAITLKFVQPSGRDGGNPKDPSLVAEILGGKRDRALASMAEAFKRTRRPIFVNLGSESNNSFFITPEESIAAFRYVHDRWRRLGVRNVAYVWKPGPGVWQPGVGLVNGNFGDFYPGDDYVDWIAAGYYGNDPETAKHTGGLKTFYTLAQLARQQGKPFMIVESGPFSGTVGTGGRQTWDSWFRPYFNDIRRFGVRAVVYNNFGVLPDDPKWGEQRIARMERSIQEAWGREMKDPMYLGASPGLFASLGFEGGTGRRPGQTPEGRNPRPSDEPQKAETKQEAIQVRRVALSLTEDGDCRFTIDTRADGQPQEEPTGEAASLAGISNGVVKKTQAGTHHITYNFVEVGSTADFAKLNGSVPKEIHGVSIDRTAGTLVMSPVQVEKLPGKRASFSFPRMLRPPLDVSVDCEKFVAGTFVVQLRSQVPTGILGINVAPDKGRGNVLVEVFLIPMMNGRRGKPMTLLNRRFDAEKVSESVFHLPADADPSQDRYLLEFGLFSEEPVTIRRLAVEARVIVPFGMALDMEKGKPRAKTVLKGSLSERAGFRNGDVIVSVGGEKPTNLKDLMALLAAASVGEELKFVIQRAGQEKTITVRGE